MYNKAIKLHGALGKRVDQLRGRGIHGTWLLS